jgi:uncharacterized protein
MGRRAFKITLAIACFVALASACEKKQSAEITRTRSESQPAITDARQRLSPELREILVDPADKGPLTYQIDDAGNEWLVNPRNGYRYPVHDGVPVMLVEEGAKHRVQPTPQAQ